MHSHYKALWHEARLAAKKVSCQGAGECSTKLYAKVFPLHITIAIVCAKPLLVGPCLFLLFGPCLLPYFPSTSLFTHTLLHPSKHPSTLPSHRRRESGRQSWRLRKGSGRPYPPVGHGTTSTRMARANGVLLTGLACPAMTTGRG